MPVRPLNKVWLMNLKCMVREGVQKDIPTDDLPEDRGQDEHVYKVETE